MTHYQFSQIFLGFAAKDRYTVAESLLYHLENYGVPVWYLSLIHISEPTRRS